MSQLELHISKRQTCACGAIIFLGLRKRLRRKIFRAVARATFMTCANPPLIRTHVRLLRSLIRRFTMIISASMLVKINFTRKKFTKT